MSPQDLEFYLSRRYPVVLRELTDEEGGGWFAEIRELPGCMSDGETPQEALDNMADAKRLWIATALKRGSRVPLPEKDEDNDYSGRLTLRMPRSLHRKLAEMARKEGISLNQFLLAVIAFRAGAFDVEARNPRMERVVFLALEGEDRPVRARDFLRALGWKDRPSNITLGLIEGGEVRRIVGEEAGSEDWTSSIGAPERQADTVRG